MARAGSTGRSLACGPRDGTRDEAEDGRVVGLHRNIGERNGKQLDTMCCIVVEVEGGRVKSGVEYFFDLHNWDRFWS